MTIEKYEGLLSLLNRFDAAARSSALCQPDQFCPHCKQFRFDPMLTRKDAWAYTGFQPNTFAIWDCKKKHDLKPIRFANAVRYRLSSLNKFGDRHLMPE